MGYDRPASGRRVPLIYSLATAPLHDRRVVYHTQMARKYRRAAASPWRVVEPDPPGPFDGEREEYFRIAKRIVNRLNGPGEDAE